MPRQWNPLPNAFRRAVPELPEQPQVRVQIENDGLMDRYLYTDTHEAIILDEMFTAVQQEKLSRSKEPQNHVAMRLTF